MADTSFPKFQFLLESPNLIIDNKYCQWFPLKEKVHFVRSRENIHHTQVWITIVSQSFLQISMVIHERSNWFTHHSNNHASACSQGNLLTSHADFCICLPSSSHRMLMRCVLKDRDLMKLIFFCFVLSLMWVHGHEEPKDLLRWVPLPPREWACQQLPPPLVPVSPRWRRQIMSSCDCWNRVGLTDTPPHFENHGSASSVVRRDKQIFAERMIEWIDGINKDERKRGKEGLGCSCFWLSVSYERLSPM